MDERSDGEGAVVQGGLTVLLRLLAGVVAEATDDWPTTENVVDEELGTTPCSIRSCASKTS